MGFLDSFAAEDTADLIIRNDAGDEWVWTFAGPGHAKTLALADRLARERLREERDIEQKRVNGKKWQPADETPDERRRKTFAGIAARVIGWSFRPNPKRAKDYDPGIPAFSEEAVLSVLLDPKLGAITGRVVDFLAEEASFTKRSA